MEEYKYYHLFANGAESRHFITCEEDHRIAFNLTGVCAANSNVDVLAFSHEESHPHQLLGGTYSDCLNYKMKFETSYKKSVAWSRGSLDGLVLNCSLYEVGDVNYLMNVGTYIINQATKDGKRVMPYDYKWGTGSLYFRPANTIPIWQIKEDGSLWDIVKVESLSRRQKQQLFHSAMDVPSDWKVCDGLILPQNYIKVKQFEQIYRTHNCFRTFLSSGRGKEDPIVQKMAEEVGVLMEDMEAIAKCKEMSNQFFGTKDIRTLSLDKRLRLALELRKRYRISHRQIATLTRLPLIEVEKYLR